MNHFKNNAVAYLALILALAFGAVALKSGSPMGGGNLKIAFVDTQRLLTSFKEAHVINQEIKQEDEKWREDVKVMEDSLKQFMDRMTAEFDNASMNRKKELQDELSMRNQQINNFRRHQVNKVAKLNEEKMAGVYEKINAFLKEYGDNKGYHIIFGTVQGGNILYGTGTAADITNEVIKHLNERYK